MVTRVTSQIMQASAINNIFRITEDLFKAQKEVASGKALTAPSDDPSGFRDVLRLSSSISRKDQFVRNVDNTKIYIQSADSSLDTVGLDLTRARELAVAELGGLSTAQTRGFAAGELQQMVSELFQMGNTQVSGNFIFSGTAVRTTPFELSSSSSAVYLGNTDAFTIGIADGIDVGISLPGSEVMAVDLDPILETTTPLASLNGGSGVTAGSFSLTDRSGNAATISVSAGSTLNSVISAINSSGVNITASINGNGLLLTDTSSVITQAMAVSEVSGTTAAELGILGSRDGNLQGSDLNPGLSTTTAISSLNGGSGLTLGSVSVVNGAASGAVNLSSATSVGDVLNLINNAGLNVTAQINSAGNALEVISNSSTSVAVVNEVSGGTTAELLGLGGGRNIINTMIKLKQALERDDTAGVLASLENIDSGIASIGDSRAELGAVLRRVESTEGIHEQDVVDQTSQLSDVQDADLSKSASELAALELALQAALSTTARILQPSILNFLQ